LRETPSDWGLPALAPDRATAARLDSDGCSVEEGDEPDRVGRAPRHVRDEVLLVESVRPGNLERHHPGIVDAGFGDREQAPRFCSRGDAQLEPWRPQPQSRQGVREPRVEVEAFDGHEAELRVQLPRPVVGEGLEEYDPCPPLRLVERVLDEGAPEPPTAKLGGHLDVLDLRDSVTCVDLARPGDLTPGPRREVARRDRSGDEAGGAVQLARDLLVSRRLAQRGERADRKQIVERDLADHRRVHATVRGAPVSEHEVRREPEAERGEVTGQSRRPVRHDNASVEAVLEHGVGRTHEGGRADRRRLDPQEVLVVDLWVRRHHEPDAVLRGYDALGRVLLEAPAELSDRVDHDASYLGDVTSSFRSRKRRSGPSGVSSSARSYAACASAGRSRRRSSSPRVAWK
jgi:hypothetical protein